MLVGAAGGGGVVSETCRPALGHSAWMGWQAVFVLEAQRSKPLGAEWDVRVQAAALLATPDPVGVNWFAAAALYPVLGRTADADQDIRACAETQSGQAPAGP